MFLVNLVGLFLFVGVLSESGVKATEHNIMREQPGDVRAAIISSIEKFCNYSQEQLNTEASMTFFEPDAKVLMPGFPPFVGHDEIRTMVELFTERASRIDIDYKVVEPMDKDANFVYCTLHFEFFNESDAKYADASELSIFKKTKDGYKFYIVMMNTHNQSG